MRQRSSPSKSNHASLETRSTHHNGRAHSTLTPVRLSAICRSPKWNSRTSSKFWNRSGLRKPRPLRGCVAVLKACSPGRQCAAFELATTRLSGEAISTTYFRSHRKFAKSSIMLPYPGNKSAALWLNFGSVREWRQRRWNS